MPKQIKKEQIKKSELLYRKWSVAGLAAAAVFMGCIVHIYSVIACVMNVRMAFIILFSALGSRSGVDTLIGSQSQNEFIQSQYASWICLAIATLFSVILGILAVVWLVKNKKN